MPEAPLREESGGLTPDGPGWFIVNVAAALAEHHPVAGSYVRFDNSVHKFEHYGINIHVVQPGQPNAKYHGEQAQESFLVLFGECILLVEGQERRMRQWDFFHCPPGVRHVLVGAGRGPCAILMAGARNVEDIIEYPASELAERYGAAAPEP